MLKTNEDDIFVIDYRVVEIKGRVLKSPTYGNFCPKCKTSSYNILDYDDELFRCVLCGYVLSGADIVRRIGEFWQKKRNEKLEKKLLL
jgi:hypothetical protein